MSDALESLAAGKAFLCVAGDAARLEYKAALVRHGALPSSRVPGCWDSDSLSAAQCRPRDEGFGDVELVRSIYGWSVRDGGFGHSILRRATGTRDEPSGLEGALKFADRWVSERSGRRYAWIRVSALKVLTSEERGLLAVRAAMGVW